MFLNTSDYISEVSPDNKYFSLRETACEASPKSCGGFVLLGPWTSAQNFNSKPSSSCWDVWSEAKRPSIELRQKHVKAAQWWSKRIYLVYRNNQSHLHQYSRLTWRAVFTICCLEDPWRPTVGRESGPGCQATTQRREHLKWLQRKK